MTQFAGSIARRLRRVRRNASLSLRGLAAAVSAAGHPVSHYAVHQYERGASQPPAGYLHALCRVLEVSPRWLLFGEASAEPHRAVEESVRRAAFRADAWRQFGSCCPDGHPLRPRFAAFSVRERRSPVPRPRSVSRRDLARRRRRRGGLLSASAPHLQFLLNVAADDRAVVFVACTDAIIIESTGTRSAQEAAFLGPGRVLDGASEAGDAAGGASGIGRTSVLLPAPRPYSDRAVQLVRLATPIAPVEGACLGALGLALPARAVRPAHLATLLHAAACIEQGLRAA